MGLCLSRGGRKLSREDYKRTVRREGAIITRILGIYSTRFSPERLPCRPQSLKHICTSSFGLLGRNSLLRYHNLWTKSSFVATRFETMSTYKQTAALTGPLVWTGQDFEDKRHVLQLSEKDIHEIDAAVDNFEGFQTQAS